MLSAMRHQIMMALMGVARAQRVAVSGDMDRDMREEDDALDRRLRRLEMKVENMEARLLPVPFDADEILAADRRE